MKTDDNRNTQQNMRIKMLTRKFSDCGNGADRTIMKSILSSGWKTYTQNTIHTLTLEHTHIHTVWERKDKNFPFTKGSKV